MATKQPEALRIANTALQVRNKDTPDDVYVALVDCAWALRNLHAENERLRTSHSDAQHAIANLQERVQQLGQLARDVNSRRVMELEAQLAAVGAGGVEPLRKRECLHQITEPAVAQAPVASIYVTNDGQREFDDWRVPLPVGRNELFAAPQPAAQASECGNCFGGETDRGHACRKCGGTGVVQPAAQAQDAQRYRWLRDHRGWQVLHRIRPGKSIKYRMQDQDGEWWGHWWPTLEQAIDAARAAQKVK